MAAPDRTRIALVGCMVGAALTGVAGALGIGGLLLLGILVETNYIPDTEAARGRDLPQRTVDTLVEHGIVEADEDILYYYSDGLISHLEDGNLFTERRVISYEQVDGELSVHSADYTAIEDIEVTWEEGWLDNTVIDVYLLDGASFQLWVSNDADRDEEFVELLLEIWQRER